MLKANKLYDCNHRHFKSGLFFKFQHKHRKRKGWVKTTTIYVLVPLNAEPQALVHSKCWAVGRYVSTNRILIQLLASIHTEIKKKNTTTPNTKSAHNHKLKSHSEFSCKYPWNYKFSYFFFPQKKCVFGVKLRHGNKHLEIKIHNTIKKNCWCRYDLLKWKNEWERNDIILKESLKMSIYFVSFNRLAVSWLFFCWYCVYLCLFFSVLSSSCSTQNQLFILEIFRTLSKIYRHSVTS